MARNADEVIQTGDIVVWKKDYAPSAAMPGISHAWADSIAGATDAGYTDGGVGLNAGAQFSEVRVDQKRDPLWRPFQGRTLEISAQLAQFAPDTLFAGTGMGDVDTVAPGATARGYNDWEVGDDSGTDLRTWWYDILQFNDESAIIMAPKGQATGSINATISRTQKGLVPATITALLDESYDPPRALLFREFLPATG